MAKLKCKLVSVYASDIEAAAVMKRLQEMSLMDIDTAASDEDTALLPEGYCRTDTSDKIKALLFSKAYLHKQATQYPCALFIYI